MKKLSCYLILILALCSSAFAAPVSAVSYTNNCATVNVTGAWSVIYASTLKAVKGILVSNPTASGIFIGVGPSGSEVAQLYIPPTTLATAVYYPMPISQVQRVSIQSYANATISSGIISVNFLFN